jgi:phosphoribosylformylglycinamidine synthase
MVGATYPEYGGSEFAELFGIGGVAPKPHAGIKTTIDSLVEAVETGKISAASDVGRGGILSALAYMCMRFGATVDLSHCLSEETELFSETSGRAILAVDPRELNSILTVLGARDVPFASIGTVGGEALSIVVGDSELTLPLETIKRSLNILNNSMIA